MSMRTLLLRLLVCVALALSALPALAQSPNTENYFYTPSGSGVNGAVGMCLNASSKAVSCTDPTALPSTATPTPNLNTGALITHTAASAGVNGADQSNLSGNAITIVVNITAITGTTPTLTVTLQGKDAASGVYYTILASAALNATGTTVLNVFPGAPVTANLSANAILPKTWRVISAITGTTPAVTATVGASVIE